MSELKIELKTINEKVRYSASARENPEIILDYFPPLGDGEGYTSLELFLISFASCLSTTLIALLRSKMTGKTVKSLKTTATGTVREEHPKAFTRISLQIAVESPDAEDADIARALVASEAKLCPVWAMLKGNVEVETAYTILR